MTAVTIKQDDTVSLKMPHYLVERLDNIAEKEDRSRSSLIRKLIVNYIEDYEDVRDATKARVSYEKDPNSATSLDELMSSMNVSSRELDKINLD
jgi:metal-responsive CopG/Arc/MetJ family transcriptional regulator